MTMNVSRNINQFPSWGMSQTRTIHNKNIFLRAPSDSWLQIQSFPKKDKSVPPTPGHGEDRRRWSV